MSVYTDYKQLLRLNPDEITDKACQFLESIGLRFCVDFGSENAIEMAAERAPGLEATPFIQATEERKAKRSYDIAREVRIEAHLHLEHAIEDEQRAWIFWQERRWA